MSMISKQIDDLRAYAKDRKGELAKLVSDAADTIEMLSAKLSAANTERSARYYHGGWIPCSERLPKYNTPVLLALKQIGKERTIVIGERRTRKSGWYFVDIAAYDPEHKVIAWMPLPEPYREERTEE